MRTYLIVLFTLFFACSPTENCRAQTSFISLDVAGSGGFGSINYEHSVYHRENIVVNMRYGFSFAPIDKNNGTNLIFPVLAHFIFGQQNHKLDIGLGQALSLTTRGSFFIAAPLALGYRFQPKEKPLYFRIAYTPILSYLVDLQWQNWAGISFAYQLKRKS